MAQYDIVFVKNDSSSGVSYSEIKLGKPSGAGYSLTQHPTTGALSWTQSMNNLGTLSGSFDYNSQQTTGYYQVSPLATPLNAPSNINGVLRVFKGDDGSIFQTQYAYGTDTQIYNPHVFMRFYKPSTGWSLWGRVSLSHSSMYRQNDFRDPPSDAGDGSIGESLALLENAFMDHTLDHVKNYGLVTVLVGDWVAEDTDLFEATVEVLGVLTTDAVDCIPDNASVDAINEAEFYPSVNVEADYIHIYAKRVPSKSVNFFVRIIKS